MNNDEFCRKWVKIHIFCCTGGDNCPFCGVDCKRRDFKTKPYKTKAGKYILIEVKEREKYYSEEREKITVSGFTAIMPLLITTENNTLFFKIKHLNLRLTPKQ